MVFTTRTYECAECGSEVKALQWDYDPPPTCHGPMELSTSRAHRSAAIVPDGIPGGLLIEHGICHADGTPKRYDSRSDIKRAARAAGWTQSGDTPKLPGDRWV